MGQNMTNPSRGFYRLPDLTRGDTLQAWSLTFSHGTIESPGEPYEIVEATAYLRDALDLPIYTWRSSETITLDGEGRITMASVFDTSGWRAGELHGGVRVTLGSGERLTFLSLAQTVIEGPPDG